MQLEYKWKDKAGSIRELKVDLADLNKDHETAIQMLLNTTGINRIDLYTPSGKMTVTTVPDEETEPEDE